MIIVKLMGGLGNQMFQYAVGKHLSEKHNVELKLDLSYLQDKTPRQDFTFRDYELDVFKLEAKFATRSEVNKFTLQSNGWNRVVDKFIKKIKNKKIVSERFFHFDENVVNASNQTYLQGYFQSEKYFRDIQNIIRKDFTFKNEPPLGVKKWMDLINKKNAVSIHFRLGDFITNQTALQHHGTCSLMYYRNAIEIMKEKLEDPHFFVFSDDIKWVRENFVAPENFSIIENKNLHASEDMRLMSLCKHNIIANSSFSWWAAWLNANDEKVVIAPQKFLNNPSYNLKDVVPENWIKI